MSDTSVPRARRRARKKPRHVRPGRGARRYHPAIEPTDPHPPVAPAPSGGPVPASSGDRSAKWYIGMPLVVMLVVTIASVIVVALLALTGMGTDSQNAVIGVVFSLGLVLGGLALRSTLPAAIQRAVTERRAGWAAAVAIGLGMGLIYRIGAGIISQIGEAIDPSLCEKAKEATDIAPPERWQQILLAVSLVVLAPVGEELLFRGLMFRGFGKIWPLLPAAVTAGVLFGLAHPQYYATWSLLVSICAMGVVQCLLYRRWGFPTVVAAHLMFNLIPAVVILAGYDGSKATCPASALIAPLVHILYV